MPAEKIEMWQPWPSRKLRVVFVNDSFRCYVDLPDAADDQKDYENQLRARTGDTVSLYRPGSPYRDAVTPPLDGTNLEVFRPGTAHAGVSQPGELRTATSSVPAVTLQRPNSAATVVVPGSSTFRPRSQNAGRFTFPNWWSALAAVPASASELDWWAGSDGRATRYERLKRVWFDATRSHWFYQSDAEDHLTTTLWENFCLFHPRDLIPAIFVTAGLNPPAEVQDACWSYEFEEPVAGRLKQTDVTLHFRDAAGDGLLVVEAKRPGGALKPSDRDSMYYLDLPSFGFTPRRFTIYLVDEHDLPAVRATIGPADPRPGFLTWQRLGALQVSLARRLPVPVAVAAFIADLIAWQYARHGFRMDGCPNDATVFETTPDAIVAATWSRLGLQQTIKPSQLEAGENVMRQIASVLMMDLPPHIRNFLAGAIQHQACWSGITPAQLGHNYLQGEPARVQIVGGMEGRQRTADRRKPLWRLPDSPSRLPRPV